MILFQNKQLEEKLRLKYPGTHALQGCQPSRIIRDSPGFSSKFKSPGWRSKSPGFVEISRKNRKRQYYFGKLRPKVIFKDGSVNSLGHENPNKR